MHSPSKEQEALGPRDYNTATSPAQGAGDAQLTRAPGCLFNVSSGTEPETGAQGNRKAVAVKPQPGLPGHHPAACSPRSASARATQPSPSVPEPARVPPAQTRMWPLPAHRKYVIAQRRNWRAVAPAATSRRRGRVCVPERMVIPPLTASGTYPNCGRVAVWVQGELSSGTGVLVGVTRVTGTLRD